MKDHLLNITRKVNDVDKSKFNYVLSQNEKNLSTLSNVFNTFLSKVTEKDISFYPNTSRLKDKLADLYRVSVDNLVLTPGSDIGIKTVFEIFDLKGKNVVTTDYCFPMYDVYAEMYQGTLKKVPYKGMRIDIQDIVNAVDDSTEFIILANPNSPLGDSYNIGELKPLLNLGIPVIIDEAYREYTPGTKFADEIANYDNIIVLKTLSKGYGGAGLRIGSIIASDTYIKYFKAMRFMYEISGLSMVYAECMLDEIPRLKADIHKLMKLKDQIVANLSKKHYNLIDTDCSWFFLLKTEEIEKIFDKHKVDIRTLELPDLDGEWYKFNVDLILNNSPLLNELS